MVSLCDRAENTALRNSLYATTEPEKSIRIDRPEGNHFQQYFSHLRPRHPIIFRPSVSFPTC